MGRLLTLLSSQSPSLGDLPGLSLWLDPSYGVYKDGAASFPGTTTNYLSAASTPGLQSGDVDFTWTGWVYFNALSGVQNIAARYNNAGQREWTLYVAGSTPTVVFSADGATLTGSQTGPGRSSGVWSFIGIVHDSVNNVIKLVNNTNVSQSPYSAGVFGSAEPFTLGSRVGGTDPLNGRIDSSGYWKRALSNAELEEVRNSGAGLTYADLTAAQKVDLVSWWNLDETTGTRADSHGSNHLSMTGTVGWDAGVASGLAGNNDPVSKVITRVGPLLTPPSLAGRPTLITNIQNGRTGLRFDGADDYLFALAAAYTLPQPFTLYIAAKKSSSTSTNGAMVDSDSAVQCATYVGDNPPSAPVSLKMAAGAGPLGISGQPLSSFAVVSAVFNGASSRLRINGGNEATGNAGTNSLTGVRVGNIRAAIAAYFFNGDLGDVVACAGAHTTAQLQQGEGIMKNIWGTP